MRQRSLRPVALVRTGLCILLAFGLASAAAEPKGTVKGLVGGEDGQPVAGARVWAYLLSQYLPIDPLRPALDVRTDAAGRFQVELAAGEYVASAAKGALVADERAQRGNRWEVEAEKALEAQIRMTKARRIQGVVVRKDDGRPVASAMIVLGSGSTTTTDAEGRFAIEAAGGEWSGLRAVAQGLGDTDAALPPPGEDELRIEMPRGFTIRGRVADEAGRPVAGARVGRTGGFSYVHIRMRSCLTDAEGRYALPGFAPKPEPPTVMALHPAFAMAAAPIEPPKEGDVLSLDLKLNKGFAIEGEVRGPDGKPIRGAEVSRLAIVEHILDPHGTARTDEKGHFRLDRLATDAGATVTIEAKGFAKASQTIKPGRGEAVPKLAIALAPGKVAKGRVVDRKGAPVAGAWLWAMLPDPGC